MNVTGLEECVPFMRFDHFTGNEVTYIFTCLALFTIPLGKSICLDPTLKLFSVCIGIGYLLIQKRKKMGLLFEPGSCRKKLGAQQREKGAEKGQMETEDPDKGIITKEQKFSFSGAILSFDQ